MGHQAKEQAMMSQQPTSDHPSIARSMLPFAGATALLLLVPAVSMQFTSEVNWGPEDFIAAAVMLLGASFVYVMAARKVKTARRRMLAGAGVLLVLLTVWAELAVGIFH
jgi:hypothetical protein